MSISRTNVFAVGGVLLIALALAFSPTSASAQQYTVYGPTWELTPFAGYYIAQDLYTVQNAGAYDGSTIGLLNSFMWGGRLGYYPKPYGGVEVSYTREGSDIEVNKSLGGYNPANYGRVNIDTYEMNFVGRKHNLTDSRVTGFGTIGFGWSVVKPEITLPNNPIDTTPDLGSNTQFCFNFGAGANVAMSPKVSMRLEARWKLTHTDISTGTYAYCDYYGYCYAYSSTTYSSGELMGGLTYKFGGK
ncbi:MAG TPA: outer membrane beta-barrel protein [Candidatus Eisenbacteria bacterium]|nr:outer membrane beta-barrel protein [Candidatus Eisenbacteria bacterium]